jgi:hypothetical protein
MLEDEVRDYQQLVEELVRHCEEGMSGTIFLSLVNGESARLVLNNGVIRWVAYGELRGEQAFDAIAGIDKARFNFNPSLKMTIGEQQLPTTLSLLKRLYKKNIPATDVLTDEPKPAVTATVSPANPPSSPPEDRPFSLQHIHKTLEKEAAQYLGPMAKVLCANYLNDLPSQLSHSEVRDVINALIHDINDDEKEQLFMKRAMKLLNLA